MSKAEILRKLHQGPRILVLPNAWDVTSARIFERAGFPAIATTSAGIAFSLGYPDGERISRKEMLGVVARVASAVKVPVTADLEAGYDDPAETARQAWAAGAVGLNFEDVKSDGALVPLEEQLAAIRAMRAATPELVINARNDIYLNGIGDEATRFERTVERLNAYRDAGADSLFAPGLRDLDTIARLARAVHGPLNILGTPGGPSAAELQALGVARVSVGSGPMRATIGLVARIAQELRDFGTYETISAGAIPYAEVQTLLGG